MRRVIYVLLSAILLFIPLKRVNVADLLPVETLAVYICRGSISRIEDKQRTVTDIELYGLAKILDVSIEELFEE